MESLGPAGLLSGALPTHYTAGLKINCVHGRRSLGFRWLLVMDAENSIGKKKITHIEGEVKVYCKVLIIEEKKKKQ